MTQAEKKYIDALKGLAVSLRAVRDAAKALQFAESVYDPAILADMSDAAASAISSIQDGLRLVGVDPVPRVSCTECAQRADERGQLVAWRGAPFCTILPAHISI